MAVADPDVRLSPVRAAPLVVALMLERLCPAPITFGLVRPNRRGACFRARGPSILTSAAICAAGTLADLVRRPALVFS